MAKELPYFKFFVSEWTDGDITLENLKIQGLFVNICSYYWSKNCKVSLKKVEKKFKVHAKLIDYLIKTEIIKIDSDNFLIIRFLDEQLIERLSKSKTNSNNASKGWEKRRTKRKVDANASNPHMRNDAIKRREEEEKKKIREELLNNKIWYEPIFMKKRIDPEEGLEFLRIFLDKQDDMVGEGNGLNRDMDEIMNHFVSWFHLGLKNTEKDGKKGAKSLSEQLKHLKITDETTD